MRRPLERVVFNEKLWELRRETILEDFRQRIRDVCQGPDGLIYLLTEEDDGAVLKIEPAADNVTCALSDAFVLNVIAPGTVGFAQSPLSR